LSIDVEVGEFVELDAVVLFSAVKMAMQEGLKLPTWTVVLKLARMLSLDMEGNGSHEADKIPLLLPVEVVLRGATRPPDDDGSGDLAEIHWRVFRSKVPA